MTTARTEPDRIEDTVASAYAAGRRCTQESAALYQPPIRAARPTALRPHRSVPPRRGRARRPGRPRAGFARRSRPRPGTRSALGASAARGAASARRSAGSPRPASAFTTTSPAPSRRPRRRSISSAPSGPSGGRGGPRPYDCGHGGLEGTPKKPGCAGRGRIAGPTRESALQVHRTPQTRPRRRITKGSGDEQILDAANGGRSPAFSRRAPSAGPHPTMAGSRVLGMAVPVGAIASSGGRASPASALDAGVASAPSIARIRTHGSASAPRRRSTRAHRRRASTSPSVRWCRRPTTMA